VLIVDAKVGPTENDLKILHSLEEHGKHIIIVVNKVDQLKNSEYHAKLKAIQDEAGDIKVFACSPEKKIGIKELTVEIMK
jgi:GTP-binding protein EngB required for normal cell division